MQDQKQFIDIDGSYGSGGGQIIRTAVGLSAVTGKPCRIFNIRGGRSEPGLKAQHLKGIEAAARLCNAKVNGASIGSREVGFMPGKTEAQHLDIDVGTAGSVTLVLQALMIPASRIEKPVEFRIAGGTHVAWSPTTGYFRHVFCECMKLMGLRISSETLRYGYYPKGGGMVKVMVEPCQRLKPVQIGERGGHAVTEAWSNASMELAKAGVGERQIEGAKAAIPISKANVKYVPSASPGSSITIASSFGNCFLGASALGERGKPAEKVGEEAALELGKVLESKATADNHMADQLIPFMALAAGKSSFIAPSLTEHAKSNIWVTEKFLDARFSVEEISGGVRIACG